MTPQSFKWKETLDDYISRVGKGKFIFLSAAMVGSAVAGFCSGLALPIPALWFLALALTVASRGAFIFFSILEIERKSRRETGAKRTLWDEMACPKQDKS